MTFVALLRMNKPGGDLQNSNALTSCVGLLGACAQTNAGPSSFTKGDPADFYSPTAEARHANLTVPLDGQENAALCASNGELLLNAWRIRRIQPAVPPWCFVGHAWKAPAFAVPAVVDARLCALFSLDDHFDFDSDLFKTRYHAKSRLAHVYHSLPIHRPSDQEHRSCKELSEKEVLNLTVKTLATPKGSRSNAPWFPRHGFSTMLVARIGRGWRAILQRHATFLDMTKGDTLWKKLAVRND